MLTQFDMGKGRNCAWTPLAASNNLTPIRCSIRLQFGLDIKAHQIAVRAFEVFEEVLQKSGNII